tara:strand:+ start:161 stop:529 length:369 start_codon:yes stop_codon:yes gene_type:complete
MTNEELYQLELKAKKINQSNEIMKKWSDDKIAIRLMELDQICIKDKFWNNSDYQKQDTKLRAEQKRREKEKPLTNDLFGTELITCPNCNGNGHLEDTAPKNATYELYEDCDICENAGEINNN